MPTTTHQPAADDFLLSKRVTVGLIQKALDLEDRRSIADFIHDRLMGRYVRPLLRTPKPYKSGFLMMASCCLLVETLESFYRGWPDTGNRINATSVPSGEWPQSLKQQARASELAFHWFFQRHKAFAELRPQAHEFYANVRCGILHQGETKGGWRVLRDTSPIFDSASLTVNANKFLAATSEAVDEYCVGLNQEPFASPLWANCATKLNSILGNCRRKP